MNKPHKNILAILISTGISLLAFIYILNPSITQAANIANPTSGESVPDFCENPTKTSTGPGNWSSSSTWSPSGVPSTNDKVLIQSGHTVTYDVSSSNSLDCVGIKGTLNFRTDTNTRMTVGTVLVYENGKLTVGTTASPIPATVTAEIVIADKAINLGSDPSQFGTGIISFGRIEMQGATKTSWSRLNAELLVGQNTIQVSESSGWRVGDTIVIVDSRDAIPGIPWNPTPETFTINAISGNQITLNRNASMEHPASRACANTACTTYNLERFAPVGNLNRSIIIRSANPNGTRGHIMVTGHATGYMKSVQIKDMGRTTIEILSSSNQKGRYAFHLHFPDITGFEFSDSAVHHSTKWGITLHHTNNQIIRNNVVYDAQGTGIMTEDGTETNNLFDRNLVMKISSIGSAGPDARASTGDFGIVGEGFWLHGAMNRLTGNVAANATIGFLLWSGSPNQPMHEFSNNEAISNGHGLEAWFVGSTTADSILDRYYEWHSRGVGIFHYPTYNFVYKDYVSRGDPRILTSDGYKASVSFGDYAQFSPRMINPDIQGKTYGIYLPYGNASTSSATRKTFEVTGGSFRNNIQAAYSMVPVGSYGPELQHEFQTIFRGTKFSNNRKADIWRHLRLEHASNPIKLSMIDVYDYQGVPGDNFAVYYKESAPSYLMPQGNWFGSKYINGPDYTGLTNHQMWTQFGAAIGGQLAPCSTERPGIIGFVCPAGSTPPPPSPTPPPASDSTAPTTSITAPTGSSLVSGTVSINANASDNVGVSRVEFYVDGNLKGNDTSSPYSYSWDTTNGGTHPCSGPHTHSLTTRAYDAANNVGISSAVTVNMNNPSYCGGGSTGVTATYIGLDSVTQGNWKGKYGSIGAYLRGEGSGNFPYGYAKNYGSLEAGGHWDSYGGPLTFDVRAPFRITTHNCCDPVPWSGGVVGSGQPWPAGARFGAGFYNRDDGATTIGAPVTYRMGLNITSPQSIWMYFYQIANINPHGIKIDIYEMTNIPYDDGAQGGIGYEPGALLDSRTITNYENGTYIGWDITGKIVLEVSAVGSNTGRHSVVINGMFADPYGYVPSTIGNPSPTPPPPTTVSKSITITLEGRNNRVVSGTLQVLNSSKALIKSYNFTTNSSGSVSLNIDNTSGSLFYKIKATPFLSRLISGDINTTLTFPQLKVGDINGDNIVNSIDFSTLNTNWFTNHSTSDLNQDGIVNSLDFSLMNRNWFVSGEV